MISFFDFMRERLLTYKNAINDYLLRFLEEKRIETRGVNVWSEVVFEKLKPFVTQGKAIRGGLVLFSYEMFKKGVDKNAVKLAAVIELLHSAWLIHDDIIDKDELRRGEKTIYAQFEDMGNAEKFKEALHFGYSLGICAGDICISGALEIIGTLDVPDGIRAELILLLTKEMTLVGLAEMDDVYMGFTKKLISEERIMKMYKHKTARYTLSLPFMLGATLAGERGVMKDKLEELGEKLGIVFQIKDDEIGIFGSSEKIGKTVGKDIIEDKKTLFRHVLFEKCSDEELMKLLGIFGNDNLTEEMVRFVRELMGKYGVSEEVYAKVQNLERDSRRIISELEVSEDDRKFLLDFLEYNLKRVK